MSKESKSAKKEAKLAKKAAKNEKKMAKSYAKFVKGIEKKNAKAEKKATKKNKPFVPLAIPTEEEFAAAPTGSKTKKIILMIVLILLIWYLIYFFIMFMQYVAPIKPGEEDGPKETVIYERYSNPHEITTTPDYSISEAKAVLKQALHDDWKALGYSGDPSSNSINYTGNVVTINNADCYVFTTGSRTYAVSVKLSAIYQKDGNEYKPITFENTDLLFYD